LQCYFQSHGKRVFLFPPLRERKEDIPLVVKFYPEKYSKSTGKCIQRISANTMRVLED
jgi:transcriptional regulator with GAF, ATPase, and Fis domain